ncbi:hypothetical protein [Streptomyces sp. NPDC050355]|uniref:hypothetical protein n=1 Tax=Streptomyces TaxID=1883 RepID=UPI00379FA85A
MKYAKSAVVVAGSVVALGAAAPAIAAQHGLPAGIQPGPKMSLNGGLNDALRSKQLDGHQVRPLVKKVKTTGEKVKSANANKLLGGVAAAAKGSPLLGGLPIR